MNSRGGRAIFAEILRRLRKVREFYAIQRLGSEQNLDPRKLRVLAAMAAYEAWANSLAVVMRTRKAALSGHLMDETLRFTIAAEAAAHAHQSVSRKFARSAQRQQIHQSEPGTWSGWRCERTCHCELPNCRGGTLSFAGPEPLHRARG